MESPSGGTPPTVAAMPPGILRRLACLLYEGLLLLALLLIAAFPVAGLKGAALVGVPHLLFQLYLCAVVAAYFTWFWTHGGQTLPMKTWRFRLLAADGKALSPQRALLRLAVATLFYLPAGVALVLVFFPQRVSALASMWLVLPMFATWWWAQFDGDRQFLHDRLAGTRLVSAD